MGNVIPMMPERGGELELPIPHPPQTPTDADLALESVAQDLCKARQRSGKSLTDVSRDLKIAAHHLIAIEAGRFESLPGRVYAIGFVRSYSAYLGLDSKEFTDRLRAELPPANLPMPLISPLSVAEPKDEEFAGSGEVHERIVGLPHPPGSKATQALFASFLIGVLIYSGNYLVVSAQRVASPPVIQVPAQLAADAGLVPKQTDASPLSVKEPVPISRAPALSLPRQVAPPQPVSIGPLVTAERVLALLPDLQLRPPRYATPTQPVDVAAEPQQSAHAPLPLGQRYGQRNPDARIILRVHRRIRMAVQAADNRIFLDQFLNPGDTYRVPNMAGLKLSASDAGAIELILDDSTIGFAGEDGVRARNLALDPLSIAGRKRRG